MPNSSTFIIGNLADDPELRFTPNGQAVARLRVAVSERYYDTGTKEWKDRNPNWYTVNCWRQLAENVSESFRRGDRVIVVGDMRQRTYEKDDETRYVWELEAREIGAALMYATATVKRATREKAAPKDEEPADEVSTRRASSTKSRTTRT